MTTENISKILREKSDIDLNQIYSATQLRLMAAQLMDIILARVVLSKI